jgi:hypothetical protein
VLSDAMRARVRGIPAGATGAMLRARVRAVRAPETNVEVALVLADGSAWGTTVKVSAEWSDVTIALDGLARVPLVLLPRPFPGFLPYDLTASATATAPALNALEAIQWGFRRAPGAAENSSMQIEVESVVLQLPPKR